MKSKLFIIVAFLIIAMASCRKAPCPAYGKTNQKVEQLNQNS